jgi:hypothetical protein
VQLKSLTQCQALLQCPDLYGTKVYGMLEMPLARLWL